MESHEDTTLSTEVCWTATKKFKRRVPIPQIKFLKKHWSKLRFKGKIFGYGFVVVPITNMVYFYSESKVDGRLNRKLWYAATIKEIITGDMLTSIVGS